MSREMEEHKIRNKYVEGITRVASIVDETKKN